MLNFSHTYKELFFFSPNTKTVWSQICPKGLWFSQTLDLREKTLEIIRQKELYRFQSSVCANLFWSVSVFFNLCFIFRLLIWVDIGFWVRIHSGFLIGEGIRRGYLYIAGDVYLLFRTVYDLLCSIGFVFSQ